MKKKIPLLCLPTNNSFRIVAIGAEYIAGMKGSKVKVCLFDSTNEKNIFEIKKEIYETYPTKNGEIGLILWDLDIS